MFFTSVNTEILTISPDTGKAIVQCPLKEGEIKNATIIIQLKNATDENNLQRNVEVIVKGSPSNMPIDGQGFTPDFIEGISDHLSNNIVEADSP